MEVMYMGVDGSYLPAERIYACLHCSFIGISGFVLDGSPLQSPEEMKYALMYNGIKREIPTEDALYFFFPNISE